MVSILGTALAWKRVGWVRGRAFDQQSLEKRSMGTAIDDSFSQRSIQLRRFGDARVVIHLIFTFDEERKLQNYQRRKTNVGLSLLSSMKKVKFTSRQKAIENRK